MGVRVLKRSVHFLCLLKRWNSEPLLTGAASLISISAASAQIYTYDSQGRVVSALYQDCSQIFFSYDVHDNRTERAVNVGNVGCTGLPPIAVDDEINLAPNASTIIWAHANDYDPDGPLFEGTTPETLTRIVSVSQPVEGSAVIDIDQVHGMVDTIHFTAGPTTRREVLEYTIEDLSGLRATASIIVNIDPSYANSAPIITSQAGLPATVVAEGTSTPVYRITAYDPDGDPLTLGLASFDNHHTVGDADAFTLDAETGWISFHPPPDFESPADAGGGNSYGFYGTVSDGLATSRVWIRINVANLANEAVQPPSAGENSYFASSGQALTLHVLNNDSDPGGGSLTISGVTAPSNGGTATLSQNDTRIDYVAGSPGIETFNYSIIDGEGATDVGQVTVFVGSDHPSAPSITSAGNSVLDEGFIGTAYQGTATDPENDPLTWTLRSNETTWGGDDYLAFNLDSNTGAVTFKQTPDYEAPQDTNRNNTYQMVLGVSDGLYQSYRIIGVIVEDVNDINQPPVITGLNPVTVDEGHQGVAYQIVASDPENEPLTYSLRADDQAGQANDHLQFSVNASTGAVSFITPPDFESPSDANANNAYAFYVRADDGTHIAERRITLYVADVAEAVPPDAVADVYTVQLSPTGVTYFNVLGNDIDNSGQGLTISNVNDGTFSVTSVQSGQVRYQLDGTGSGSFVDSFTYTVIDGNNLTDTATATVNVTVGGGGGGGPEP